MSNESLPEGSESKPSEASGGEKGQIRLLSDALVDQIAAGEVVERPASVVKELVENSLDAEATRIRVDVRDGGAALIAVTDDGRGMQPAEMPLALQRHATSKLQSAADLMRIGSFGFRGEALPAIASVSRFRMFSRARGQEHGYEIVIESGVVMREAAAGGPVGTRIEVADLFSAVPARRKFLKRPGTEWGHIADWLTRLAMVRPEIHIESQRDDRAPIVWPACQDPRDRIAALLSEDDAAALLEVDTGPNVDGIRVRAFLSTPERTRPNGNALFLFVNGRPVRDRLLRGALVQAYRDLLPRGRFPVAVLFLEVPLDVVDVNVHPAKWEVRFVDPQSIHRAIRYAVRDAMSSRTWLGTISAPTESSHTSGSNSSNAFAGSSAKPSSSYPASGASSGTGSSAAQTTTDDWVFAQGAQQVAEGDGSDPLDEGRDVSDSGRITHQGVAQGAGQGANLQSDSRPVQAFGSLRRLGQLRASYLLAESEDGLLVIDQHAAHERILYEGLRRDWLARGVARQGLLTPVSVALAPSALEALLAAAPAVLRMGFEVEAFGEGTVLVRALPAELAGQNVQDLITELSAALEESDGEMPEARDELRFGDAQEAGDDVRGESRETDERDQAAAIRWLPRLDRLFATLACHSARRFGDRLPAEEQQAILEGLDTIPWAPTCPHGRPVAILIDQFDLEARFRRR